MGLERYEEAIADFTKAIEIDPSSSAYISRGLARQKLNQYENAIADYDKAIQFDDKYSHAYMVRGIAKASLEKYEDSILDFDKAIEIDESSDALVNRGIVRAKQNQYENAIADFNKAIQLENKNSNPFFVDGRFEDERVTKRIQDIETTIKTVSSQQQQAKELEAYIKQLRDYKPAALAESYDEDINRLKEQLFGTSSGAEASQKQLALTHRIWHLAKHPLLMVLIIIPLLVFIFAASSHHLIHSELFTPDICERSTIPYCQMIALTFNPWIWGLTIIFIMMMKSSDMKQEGLVKASRKIARQLRFYILIIWLLVTDLYFNIFGLSTSGIIAPTGSLFITSARYALSLFFVLTPFLLYYRHVSRRERELYVLWLSMKREKHRQLFWMVQAKTDPDDLQGKLSLPVLNHMNENSAADMALQMLKPRTHTPQSLGWFRPRENHIHSIRYEQNNP